MGWACKSRLILLSLLLPCLLVVGVFSSIDRSHQLQADEKPTPPVAPEPPEEPLEAAETLPLYEEMELPDVKQLLTGEKRDWILLIGGRVLDVPALNPRPDHVAWLEREQKNLLDDRPAAEPALAEWLQEYQRYFFIYLTAEQDGMEDDYRLHVRYVDRILYHEDLCLQKADEFLREKNPEAMREMLSYVSRQELTNNERRKKELLEPIDWPGLIDRERKLLKLEVELALERSAPEAAFSLVQRRMAVDKKDSQIPELLATILNQIGENALKEYDYRKLRYFINRILEAYSDHEGARQWRQRIISEASARMNEAEQYRRAGEHRQASISAQQAIRIWPFSGDLLQKAQLLQDRYQTLDIGVVKNEAAAREIEATLANHTWFRVSRLATGYPRFASRFLESWYPDELGTVVRLQMANRKSPGECRPELNAQQFANALIEETLNRSSNEQDLFSRSITAIQVPTPDQILIRLRSQTPHPLNLLAGILRKRPGEPSPLLTQTHFPETSEVNRLPFESPSRVFVRSFENGPRERRGVAEVHLFEYEDDRALLQSLLRDEVMTAPETPLQYVDQLRDDKRFLVLPYDVPRVYSLNFLFEGRFGSNNELRLALLTMLDREQIRYAIHPAGSNAARHMKVTDSLCPSSSHAYLEESFVPLHDEVAARALYTLLQRLSTFQKKISLAVSPTQNSKIIGEEIAKTWTRLGLDVELKEARMDPVTGTPDLTELSCDVVLLEYVMNAPQYEVPAMLEVGNRVKVANLAGYPTYIRRLLLELENARNLSSSDEALRRLQQQLTANGWFFPILEVDRYLTARREIRNLPKSMISPFQMLDQWAVEPVVPGY